MSNSIIIPSNPADRTKLKQMVNEAVDALTRVDSEREHIKEIKEEIKENFELPPKAISKIIILAHKRNAEAFAQDAEDTLELYEALFSDPTSIEDDSEFEV
jgi:hypothetical protein